MNTIITIISYCTFRDRNRDPLSRRVYTYRHSRIPAARVYLIVLVLVFCPSSYTTTRTATRPTSCCFCCACASFIRSRRRLYYPYEPCYDPCPLLSSRSSSWSRRLRTIIPTSPATIP